MSAGNPHAGTPFLCLSDIREAREQAQAAIAIYEGLHLPSEDLLYRWYDTCSIYHLFSLAQNVMDLRAFCHPGLLAMYDKHGADSNPYHILKTYLKCCCNISNAAELLHMHRNNVIYHLRRMETRYHFNLNHFRERFHLELSLNILEYLEKNDGTVKNNEI